MAQSPWRQALDGQVAILRELRKPSSLIHLGYMLNVPALREYYPNASERATKQIDAAAALAEGIATLIREADPIYLTHDIIESVWKNVMVGVQSQDSLTLDAAMLPIPAGLIWFGPTGLTLEDVVDPGTLQGSINIRALYFGSDIEVRAYPNTLLGKIRVDVSSPELSQRTGMGVMAFLDAQKSGYAKLYKEFGNHMVPVPLGAWPYGVPLEQYVKLDEERPRASGINLDGTTALITLCNLILYEMFQHMLRRLTLWGGINVHPNQRRDADKENLRPRVQVVTWRKANYQYPEGHIPVPKDWSCRWPVREHLRRYRSGKVVTIRSYVKGPDGKPLKSGNTHVHQVKR